jgi:hypothetical protein
MRFDPRCQVALAVSGEDQAVTAWTESCTSFSQTNGLRAIPVEFHSHPRAVPDIGPMFGGNRLRAHALSLDGAQPSHLLVVFLPGRAGPPLDTA